MRKKKKKSKSYFAKHASPSEKKFAKNPIRTLLAERRQHKKFR